jgi:hypothetical protein
MSATCIKPLAGGELTRFMLAWLMVSGFAIYGMRRFTCGVLQPWIERIAYRFLTRGAK